MKIKSNILKKILLIFVCTFISFASTSILLNAETQPLVINNRTITLKDGTVVQINTEYTINGSQFRGVWVSALTNDINGFSSEESYKKEITRVFNTLEKYNINAVLFHVRIMNDAFYESDYNNWSSYYNTNPSWDALPWIIEECHKRGIEFHAWMNPYRVTTNVAISLEDLSKNYKSSNAASNPAYLLKGSSCVILNPGEPAVRSFLIKTCMELVEKYNVDAIHFDDYFYTAGIDDSVTRAKYNTTNMSVDNWRRAQIDTFIETLSKELRLFNEENNRRVQLGISPTGAYANGNGVVTYDAEGNASSNGSQTSAYAHYGSPLYANTLKWINEEWIDYILPQTYWGITNSSGPFCDLTNWWNKVVKYSKVNFYAALGLYMSYSTGNASWSTNDLEGYQQTMYANTLSDCQGLCVYDYSSLSGASNSSGSFKGMQDIWNQPVISPEVRTMDPIIIDPVTNLIVESNSSGNKISFDVSKDAKFYVLYRDTKPITYTQDQLLDIFGNVETNGVVSYPDTNVDLNTKYYYAVKCLSYSNTLSEGVTIDTSSITNGELCNLGTIENFSITENVVEKEEVMVYWKELYYPFGSDITYKATYYLDDKEYVVTSFSTYRLLKCFNIQIPEGAKKLKIVLEATNDVGASTAVIEREVGLPFLKVTNFGALTEVFSDTKATFVFNTLDVDDVLYTLQYSYNTLVWYDDVSFEGQNSFNTKVETTIQNAEGEIYYRIKSTKDGYVSYSENNKYLLVNLRNEFEDLATNDIAIDGKENIVVNEYEDLVVTFTPSTTEINYIVYYSTDLKNWITISIYNNKSTFKTIDDKFTVTIPINYKYFTFYLKIEGSSDEGNSYSPIVKINCQLIDLFYEDVLKTIAYNVKNEITSLNIFN